MWLGRRLRGRGRGVQAGQAFHRSRRAGDPVACPRSSVPSVEVRRPRSRSGRRRAHCCSWNGSTWRFSVNGAAVHRQRLPAGQAQPAPVRLVSSSRRGSPSSCAWVHLVCQVVDTAFFVRAGRARRRGRARSASCSRRLVGRPRLVIVCDAASARRERASATALEDLGPTTLAASLVRQQRVRRTRNITSRRSAGQAAEARRLPSRVDAARAPGQRRPAILQIHGGGWVIGDKREQGLPLLNHLAAEGWVGFNANYRLSPRRHVPRPPRRPQAGGRLDPRARRRVRRRPRLHRASPAVRPAATSPR